MLTAREPFYRVGGDFSFNYHTFNLFGQFIYGRDQNLLPVIPAGQPLPTGFGPGSPAHFSGGFLEADYIVLSLDDGDHALGPREFDRRLSQWRRRRPEHSSGLALLSRR